MRATAHPEHPHQTPDGHTVTLTLDWSDSSHWGGRLQSCRSCHQPTRLLDDQERPQHKACAEHEAELQINRTAQVRQRQADDPRPSRDRPKTAAEAEPEAVLW